MSLGITSVEMANMAELMVGEAESLPTRLESCPLSRLLPCESQSSLLSKPLFAGHFDPMKGS